MSQPPEQSDGELLAEFNARRSEPAFAELIQRHGNMVHGVCRRVLADHHEAQDVTQAVFLTLARKGAALHHTASIGGWLHTVAWRLAKDVQASRFRRQRREERAMHDQPLADTAPSDTGLFKAELDAALNQLPERYRQPLVLFHLEGQSLDEVGTALGLNPNTLRTRLVRARELLRKKLVTRGIAVGSVGALTALLSAESGAAVLPATFVASTVSAATGGTVSTTVAALTKGALHAMFIAKVKTVSLAAAACLVVTGSGVVVATQLTESHPAAPATITLPATEPVQLAEVAPAQPPIATPAPVPAKVADQPVRFTEADNGKTVTVKLGQTFEVLLLNGREGAGWEPAGGREITGASVELVNKLRPGNCDEFMAEKAPTPDTTLGMYKYRYNAVKIGTSIIRLVHEFPSGPVPKVRKRSALLGEFKLIVEVTADGAGALPVVNEYVAQQTAQFWVTAFLQGRNDQLAELAETPFCLFNEQVGTAEELATRLTKAQQDAKRWSEWFAAGKLRLEKVTLLKGEAAAFTAGRSFKKLANPGNVALLRVRLLIELENERGAVDFGVAIQPANHRVAGFGND